MTELLTQAEYARHRGVARKTVTQWKKAGRLVWHDGKIDRDASDTELDGRGLVGNGQSEGGNADANTSPRASEPAPVGSSLRQLIDHLDLLTKHEAEQVKENYLARQRKLEYERQAAEVVSVDSVAQEVASEYAKVRSKLLALPTELAPQLAQEFGGDANAIRERLAEGITKALEELTDDRYRGHGG